MTKVILTREKYDISSSTVIDKVHVEVDSPDDLHSVSAEAQERFDNLVRDKLEKRSKGAV